MQSSKVLESPVHYPVPAGTSQQGYDSKLLRQPLGLGHIVMTLLLKLLVPSFNLLALLGRNFLLGTQTVLLGSDHYDFGSKTSLRPISFGKLAQHPVQSSFLLSRV
jgi:hypothetical protein